MKTCSSCNKNLSFDCFNFKSKNPIRYQSKCIECNKEYQRRHYRKNKDDYIKKNRIKRALVRNRVSNIKSKSPCSDCGLFFHFCQMDFDHIRDKTESIGSMVSNGSSWKSIKLEINKCELVCANCHRLRTFNRRSSGA